MAEPMWHNKEKETKIIINGEEWISKSHLTLYNNNYRATPTASPKMPSLDNVMKHKKFTPGMNWVEEVNEIYNTIKKLGNFT